MKAIKIFSAIMTDNQLQIVSMVDNNNCSKRISGVDGLYLMLPFPIPDELEATFVAERLKYKATGVQSEMYTAIVNKYRAVENKSPNALFTPFEDDEGSAREVNINYSIVDTAS